MRAALGLALALFGLGDAGAAPALQVPPALVPQAAGPALALIEDVDDQALAALIGAGYCVTRTLHGIALAYVQPVDPARLGAAGLRARVLEADVTNRGCYLLWGRAPAALERAVRRAGARLLWTRDRLAVVSVAAGTDVGALAAPDVEIEALFRQAVRVRAQTAARPPRRPLARDTVVLSMVQRVSSDSLTRTVAEMEAFGTRRADTPEAERAAAWIEARFRSFGIDSVFVHRWTPAYAPNVVAVIPGTTYPDNIYVVGGHYDSISYQGSAAPGADDNASGTAAVLECARILSQYRFACTLHFAAFGAEEFGLWGSNAYAGHLAFGSGNVQGMLNLDMIGYLAPGSDRDLDIIANGPSAWLRDRAHEVASVYVASIPPVDGVLQWGSSDHQSFWRHGIDAIFFFEDVEYPSPFIHTGDDILWTSYNDSVQAREFTQVSVALLATLAQPVAVPVVVEDFAAWSDGDSVRVTWRARGDGAVRVQRAAAALGPYRDRTLTALVPRAEMRFVDTRDDLEPWYRLAIDGDAGAQQIVGPVRIAALASIARTILHAPVVPTSGPVQFRFALARPTDAATLAVYDVAGRELRRLALGARAAGEHVHTWDLDDASGRRLARGIYLARLEADTRPAARKVVLARD